jgi:hypothetical protein
MIQQAASRPTSDQHDTECAEFQHLLTLLIIFQLCQDQSESAPYDSMHSPRHKHPQDRDLEKTHASVISQYLDEILLLMRMQYRKATHSLLHVSNIG